MTHRIAVIGGDGIGPEVVAEALKVVACRRRRSRHGRLRPRRRPLPAGRHDPARRGPRGAAGLRRHPARRGRHPGRAARGHRAGPAAEDALRARPVRQPAAVRPARAGHRHGRDPREHRGTYAGEGGFLRKGTPHEIATQGSVNTRMGVERCIRYAFDLAAAAGAQAPHPRAQDERADLRRRPLAAHLRRGGGRVPRRRHRLQPRRRGVHPLRAGPRSVRRDRHRQPLRRHPHRPRRRGLRAASGSPPPATSTPTASRRRCSSRSTARRPTSRAPAPPTRSPPSSAWRCCSTSSARPQPPTASAPHRPRRPTAATRPHPPPRSATASPTLL